MKLIPCEADLGSDNHDTFAAAINCCNGYAPECIAAGACQMGGCFEPVVLSESEAQEEIKRLNSELQELRARQTILEATVEHHIQMLHSNYASQRNAINESHRWAIHFARQKFIDLQKDLKGERK